MNKTTAEKMIQLFENDIKIYQTLISNCGKDDAHLIESYKEKINSIEKTITQISSKIKNDDNQNGCY